MCVVLNLTESQYSMHKILFMVFSRFLKCQWQFVGLLNGKADFDRPLSSLVCALFMKSREGYHLFRF